MVFYSSEISSDRIEVLHRPGIFAGSIVGGLIGAKIDNGNILGFWSLIMGGVGSLFGIWIGYIINKNYF